MAITVTTNDSVRFHSPNSSGYTRVFKTPNGQFLSGRIIVDGLTDPVLQGYLFVPAGTRDTVKGSSGIYELYPSPYYNLVKSIVEQEEANNGELPETDTYEEEYRSGKRNKHSGLRKQGGTISYLNYIK